VRFNGKTRIFACKSGGMNIKQHIAAAWGAYAARQYRKKEKNAVKDQCRWLKKLIKEGRRTRFGREHDFDSVRDYDEYKKAVRPRTYEDFKPYIDRIVNGAKNELWPGRPLYFAKTSGTTSGTKYIPISRQSMPFHVKAARDMLLLYLHKTGNTDFLTGKMIFLQGSPLLRSTGGIPTGRLSGIAAHYVPKYFQKQRLPSWETNIIEDWTVKIERIVNETLGQDMTLVSGIPSWVQHYFEKLIERAGKPVGEIFPRLSVLIHGGVNFEPYRKKFAALLGRKIDMLETYPASEGFIAFRSDPGARDLMLLTDHGIFYEFIPMDKIREEGDHRIPLAEVKPGIDYALLLTTNAGLWSYMIGDVVRFTSVRPYRLQVTGRVNHFISAFGEHVIAKETETALSRAAAKTGAVINAFSVAPQITPAKGLPYHEWLIEFEQEPENPALFRDILDQSMQKQNIYYADLIKGKILRPPVISFVRKGGFHHYMAAAGKLGGQNKIPVLKNDRSLADFLHLQGWIEKQLR